MRFGLADYICFSPLFFLREEEKPKLLPVMVPGTSFKALEFLLGGKLEGIVVLALSRGNTFNGIAIAGSLSPILTRFPLNGIYFLFSEIPRLFSYSFSSGNIVTHSYFFFISCLRFNHGSPI